MLNLNSHLEYSDIEVVQELSYKRYVNPEELVAPEALVLYEQRYLSDALLKQLCEEAYKGVKLEEPPISFVPHHIIDYFKNTNYVPLSYGVSDNSVVIGTIPELNDNNSILIQSSKSKFKLTIIETTPHYYFKNYCRIYKSHKLLSELPAKDLYETVINEAIQLGAADITFSGGPKASVYYNVRKRKVNSNRIISSEVVDDIVKMLTIASPMDESYREPKYVDIDINNYFRGRVIINRKFKGYTVTIRLLPQEAFDAKLVELNLTKDSMEFINKSFLDTKNGLRLLIGETMSGKNTTCLAVLKKVVDTERFKVVSVELPVEQELQGVEQISCNTVEEFGSNIKSLIHQNPDFVYVAEIRDLTGKDTLNITNTGKRVLSTLHSNSLPDVVTRLCDITGYSADRVIQNLHSVVFQELVRDEDNDSVAPRCKYLEFTDELKYELYGKGIGEISRILKSKERGDEWISSKSIQ